MGANSEAVSLSRTSRSDDPVGEILSVPGYLVVAPATGVFRSLAGEDGTRGGQRIERGDVIGLLRSLGVTTPVESPFAGLLVEILACEGERVRPGQPLAWLRAA